MKRNNNNKRIAQQQQEQNVEWNLWQKFITSYFEEKIVKKITNTHAYYL